MSTPLGNVDPDTMRVVLPRVSKRRPNNPLRPRRTSRGSSTEADEKAAQASSDGRSSIAERKASAIDRNLLRSLLQIEQREFVTGTAGPPVRAAHILDALCRRKDQTKSGFEAAKTAIEEWLTHIGFLYDDAFALDAPCNLILLRPDLFIHWDTYGTIAFTPPMSHLKDLSCRLAADNEAWNQRSFWTPDAPRKLTHEIYDTKNVNWQVLVLHPDDFLPEEEPFGPVLKPEFRHHREGVLPDSGSDCWELCHLATDPDFHLPTLFRGSSSSSSGQPLFLRPVSPLSLFAMVVNLQSKVDACREDEFPNAERVHLAFLKQLLNGLVEKIFYRRQNWTRVDAVIEAIAESVATADPPAVAPPGDSTSLAPVQGAQLPDVSRSDESTGDAPRPMVPLEDHPDLLSPESPADSSVLLDVAAWAGTVPEGVMDNEEDAADNRNGNGHDDVDAEHGTTMSEYITLARRVVGPSTSRRSKATDVKHLFYGTHGFQIPPGRLMRQEAAAQADPEPEG